MHPPQMSFAPAYSYPAASTGTLTHPSLREFACHYGESNIIVNVMQILGMLTMLMSYWKP